MSPEQCEGAEVDARSDVYTCGAVMYRVLVGRVPFCGAIALDTMLRHLRDPPTPPSAYVSDLDPRLEAVVLKALAKRPDERQQSARALAAELSALLPELERADRSPQRSRRTGPRHPRVSRGISAPRGSVLVASAMGSAIEAPATDPDPPTDPDTTTSRQLARGYRASASTDVADPVSEVITDAQTAKFARKNPPLAAPRSVPRPVPRAAPPPPTASPLVHEASIDEPPTPIDPRGASLLVPAVNAASVAPAVTAPVGPQTTGSHDAELGASDTIVMARSLAPAFVEAPGRDLEASRASVPSFPPGIIGDPARTTGGVTNPAQRPVPVLRLFVLTFSIVLVLGIALLRLAGEH
jgi:serine/threonine-protein kinase